MSYDSVEPLDDLMVNLVFQPNHIAPDLERLIVAPHTATIARYLLECGRGVQVEPALSHDTMAFLAAGNAYGFKGETTKVTFKVENEYVTNKGHYYAPVRAICTRPWNRVSARTMAVRVVISGFQ